MKNLVTRGPQPIRAWKKSQPPLISAKPQAQPRETALDSLVLLSVTLRNRVGAGRGPQLLYSEAQELVCAKKPHEEAQSLLESLKSTGHVREALIWNTCYRFECYAWLARGQNGSPDGCIVASLREKLFGAEPAGLHVNTLFAGDAWHHLMRTIAGLNSGLPGDKDVVEQFQTAYQLAERAGTAGPHAEALVDEAVSLARSVRQETAWGRLDPGYCFAAITRIQDALPLKLANCRHVVVGGSTTSRSVLEALYEQFGVQESSVTLAYRSHQGGQMKLLRKAVGHGRRLRTNSYSDQPVLDAIADADVVYFGIDREEPVLTAETLRGLRDFAARPLFILDFNSSGSTLGLEGLPGIRLWRAAELDVEVEAFADWMCAREEFPRSVQEAEAWIEGRAPTRIALNLDLPCRGRDEHGYPMCVRCGKALAASPEHEQGTVAAEGVSR